MTLLCYLKPASGLSDPSESLSSSVHKVIAEINKKVTKIMDRNKHDPYKWYCSILRAEIAKYACQHGAAAAWHYLRKLKKPISKSTVKLIKKCTWVSCKKNKVQ